MGTALAHDEAVYTRAVKDETNSKTSTCERATLMHSLPSMHCRGCGGVPLTTPKIFCQADTSDMFVSIKEIRSQFPDAPVFAVGFSLGGYTLNKYVGQVDTGVYSQGTLFRALTNQGIASALGFRPGNPCWQCLTFQEQALRYVICDCKKSDFWLASHSK